MIAASLYDWLPGIITAIFSGGITGSIVALLKVRQEAGAIVVTAAQGALVVQTGVIDTLNKRVEALTKENEQLRAKVASLEKTIQDLNCRIDNLTKNQIRHDIEVKDLQGKNS